MGILSKFRDIIRGALGTYVLLDKLEDIRTTLAAPDLKDLRAIIDEMRMRLARQEEQTAVALASQKEQAAAALAYQAAAALVYQQEQAAAVLAHQAALAEQKEQTAAALADQDSRSTATALEAMRLIRAEYTVMPRFAFHQPTDYLLDSEAPQFEPAARIPGEALPLPAPPDRYGYPSEDTEYLASGSYDADLIRAQIRRYLPMEQPIAIMDFGCSTGRVLRHFHPDHMTRGWQLYGVDVQARCIEWLRQNFPPEFIIYTGTTLPMLPFADNSLDVIYGMSVFTHIKYLWDAWLLELRRVLRPGGLLIQSIHTEHAWEFYHRNRQKEWVRAGLSSRVYDTPAMDLDWFHHGDISVSQTFWKREVAHKYWGRYIDVLDILPPPEEHSFQDWMICRKPVGRTEACG